VGVCENGWRLSGKFEFEGLTVVGGVARRRSRVVMDCSGWYFNILSGISER
jgi:hypothetical protein